MIGANLIFTRHAQDMLREREIDPAWVQIAVDNPEKIEPDPRRPGVLLAFRSFPERGGRVLRVAHVRSGVQMRVLTVFFDRSRRKDTKRGET